MRTSNRPSPYSERFCSETRKTPIDGWTLEMHFSKPGRRKTLATASVKCWSSPRILLPLLLRVADFHFQIGENQEALAITARILALIPDYDSVIFSDYIRSVDRAEDVLRLGLPEGSRAAQSWLRFLIQAGRLDDAQRTWDWVVAHGYADDTLAGEYVEFLIRQGHPDSAASAWARYMGARADDYDKSTYLFNGDFESDPAPIAIRLERSRVLRALRSPVTAQPPGRGNARFASASRVLRISASQLLRS